jgi:hypothetical protein
VLGGALFQAGLRFAVLFHPHHPCEFHKALSLLCLYRGGALFQVGLCRHGETCSARRQGDATESELLFANAKSSGGWGSCYG